MKVEIKKLSVPFTQIANVVIKDKRLSCKAKGLFTYIYSKPENWDFSADRMAKECTDGIRAINNGMQELEDAGYLTRKKRGDGKVSYYITYEPDCQNSNQLKQQIAETAPISNIVLYSNKEKEYATTSVAPVNVKNFFDNNRKDGTVSMGLSDFVLMCRGSDQRHVRIIGEYADDLKPDFSTRGQWSQFGRRNMRPARNLVPYTDRQLVAAMNKIMTDSKDNGGFITHWSLETLEKYLDK